MQVKNEKPIRRWNIRIHAVWTALAVLFALVSGCAGKANISRQAGASAVERKPVDIRPENSRQGFVIRENPRMDDESRDEFRRAVALMNEGKNEKAIELLTKVIDRSPGVTAPSINIAIAYMRTGKPDAAEKHLKAALEIVPRHPVASNEYGLLLRRAGRFQEARAIYEQSLARYPDYLPLRRNLGILCDLYLNDPECALKQFGMYSEGMPADAQVKIWIAELGVRLGRAKKPVQEAKPPVSRDAPKTGDSAQDIRQNGDR